MSTTAPPIRLAVLGLGWVFTNVWAPMLRDHAGFRVVAVLDPDAAALARGSALFPDARPLSTVADIDPSEVDLVVVAPPNHLHAPLAATLLRRGIPVFVEKPVCLSSAEAAQLVEAERAGGARVLAGTAAWHRADVKALRAQVDRLGPLRTVELSWLRARGVPGPGGWFTSGEEAGGGALLDLGWHLITVGLRMIGWPAVPDVLGTVSADFLGHNGFDAAWHTGNGSRRADVEDTARASFRTDSGVFFTLAAAWASHTNVDRTTISVEGAHGRIELVCTFGFSPHRLTTPSLRLLSAGRSKEIYVPAEPPGAEYRRQLDLLPALLADPNQPGAATAETVRIVELIERIYRSAGATTVDLVARQVRG